MSLSAVSAQLKNWADAAALKAVRANDPDTVHVMQQVADQYRTLLKTVQGAAVELQEARRKLAEVPAQKPPKVLRRGKLEVMEFWAKHGEAVNAIISVYGLDWKTRAPFGDTVLVTLPPGWRSAKTGVLREDGGNAVRWRKDGRMPAARFWPGQKLPDALLVEPDYEREYLWDGYGPPEAHRPHNADWHKAHGYVWTGSEWVFEIQMRNSQNYADAIEAYKAARVRDSQIYTDTVAAFAESKRLADDEQLMAAE